MVVQVVKPRPRAGRHCPGALRKPACHWLVFPAAPGRPKGAKTEAALSAPPQGFWMASMELCSFSGLMKGYC